MSVCFIIIHYNLHLCLMYFLCIYVINQSLHVCKGKISAGMWQNTFFSYRVMQNPYFLNCLFFNLVSLGKSCDVLYCFPKLFSPNLITNASLVYYKLFRHRDLERSSIFLKIIVTTNTCRLKGRILQLVKLCSFILVIEMCLFSCLSLCIATLFLFVLEIR